MKTCPQFNHIQCYMIKILSRKLNASEIKLTQRKNLKRQAQELSLTLTYSSLTKLKVLVDQRVLDRTQNHSYRIWGAVYIQQEKHLKRNRTWKVLKGDSSIWGGKENCWREIEKAQGEEEGRSRVWDWIFVLNGQVETLITNKSRLTCKALRQLVATVQLN